MKFEKILIIQTAFIGDVILATPLIEKLHQFYPDAKIDFLLRKGNESILKDHPIINKIYIWKKEGKKYKNLFYIGKELRRSKYDLIVNAQRFASTGLLTVLANAKVSVGFNKNPFSFLFSKVIAHKILKGKHEVERNLELIKEFTDDQLVIPKLYPSSVDSKSVQFYKEQPYICIAPTSVWFTKQYPENKWIEFLHELRFDGVIYLLGAPSDAEACQKLKSKIASKNIVNLAGTLSLLQSAALMKDAVMNYVNDSAPLHLSSAVNAPTCAVYCSTVPDFGFFPLSDKSTIVELEKPLKCRPCGLHGYKACPLGHFKCAQEIDTNKLVQALSDPIKYKF